MMKNRSVSFLLDSRMAEALCARISSLPGPCQDEICAAMERGERLFDLARSPVRPGGGGVALEIVLWVDPTAELLRLLSDALAQRPSTDPAAAVGCSQQMVSQMMVSGRVTAEMAIRIERSTGGIVMRHELRPDLFDERPAPPATVGEAASPSQIGDAA